SRELSALARLALTDDSELGLLLAMEAVRTAFTPQADAVLRNALLHAPILPALRGHTEGVTDVAFAPDGATIATASLDGSARLGDAATGRRVATLRGHFDHVWSVAFSPDSKLTVTASDDHTARVWQVPSGQEIAILGGHRQSVNTAVFSPDGRAVLTVS